MAADALDACTAALERERAASDKFHAWAVAQAESLRKEAEALLERAGAMDSAAAAFRSIRKTHTAAD